jgi:hypothetical protein
MDDFIAASAGLDVHVDSITIGAAAGQEPPRLAGTVARKLPSLLEEPGHPGLAAALRIFSRGRALQLLAGARAARPGVSVCFFDHKLGELAQ